MVSSLSGLAGLPGASAYAASKFALEGLSESLRYELSPWDIRVALVEPGGYKTRLQSRLTSESKVAESDYQPMLSWLAAQQSNLGDPETVARVIVEIASSKEDRLRWTSDETGRNVVRKLIGNDLQGRDDFLRKIAGVDFWQADHER